MSTPGKDGGVDKDMNSPVRAAGPAAGPAHPILQLAYRPFNMLSSGLVFLYESGPADPLVTRKRRDILPRRESRSVGSESLPQVLRHFVRRTCGDPFFDHKMIVSKIPETYPLHSHPTLPWLLPARLENVTILTI